MTRYTSIALALMAAALLLAGCGSSKFKQGEKVWIALDGQTISKDGHAEGIAVGAKENLVQVQVSNIAADNNNDLLGSLHAGQATYIPTKQVYTVEKGQQRADQRHKLLEDLQEFFPKGTNPSPNEILEILQNKQNAIKRFSDLRDRAEHAHVNEIAAAAGIAVVVLKKAQAVMATTPEGKAKLRMDDKLAKRVVAAGPESFPQLKKTLKHYHFYDDFVKNFDAHPGNLDSIEQDLAKVNQQLLAFDQVEHGGEPISQWISVNPVAKILSAVSLGYIWASDTYMQGATAAKAAELKNMLKSSTAGEVALAEFSFGQKLDSDSVKDIKAHVKTALAGSIQSDIVRKVKNPNAYQSATQSRAAYLALKKQVQPAEDALDIKIPIKKDKQYFDDAVTLIALVRDRRSHNGVTKTPYGTDAKFVIRFTSYDPDSGKFKGTMTWPSFGDSRNAIEGSVRKDHEYDKNYAVVELYFTEVSAIDGGSWQPGDDYTVKIENGALAGDHGIFFSQDNYVTNPVHIDLGTGVQAASTINRGSQ